MQIAFPTNIPPSDAANVYRVSINGYSFNVYSQSFLGLGGDDARKYVKAYNYSANNGGVDCYASTATSTNTQEKSGVQLYPINQVTGTYPYPSNTNLLTPWTSLSVNSLLLTLNAIYSASNCSNMYNTIEDQVTSLPRNNYGTFNDGTQVTIASFKTNIETSIAPFVGTDNFFYTSNDLRYSPSTGFIPSIFQANLDSYCTGVVANNVNAQNVCPNGNFMNSYLFGTSGLFTNSSATFAGVLNPANPAGDTVLTWTRGYLLLKYAN